MFDMMKMMGELRETRKRVEETKKRLQEVYLSEESTGGLVKVKLSVAQEIQTLSLDKSLLGDKEQLEDYLIATLNKALERAKAQYEKEIAEAAKEGIPGLPF